MEEFFTPEQVATALKVEVETVWRWCRSGLGRRVGRQYRITRADLDSYFPKDTARGLTFTSKGAA